MRKSYTVKVNLESDAQSGADAVPPPPPLPPPVVVSPAVEVRDLRKYYGDKAAVDGLSLLAPRGCFFGC
jgi:hypothetical protein